jgi:hypothetical protein
VAHYNEKAFEQFEARLAAVEAQCQTEEEREISRLVFKIVKSIKLTVWLLNGAVKYFAGPLGIAFGVWVWGESAVEWLVSKSTGLPR